MTPVLLTLAFALIAAGAFWFAFRNAPVLPEDEEL